MKLAVVCGRKSEDIKKRLLSIHDNLQIDAYEDIDTLITNSIQRQYFYDRILFASHIVRGDEIGNFQTLKDYVINDSPRTEVVYVCSAKDTESAKDFDELFNTPNYSSYLSDRVTLETLKNASVMKIEDIFSKYSYLKERPADSEVDYYDIDDESTEPEEEDEEEEEPVKQPKGKKEKKGLFGGLLRGKKKASEQVQQEQQAGNDLASQDEYSDDTNWEDAYYDQASSEEGYEDDGYYGDEGQNYDTNYDESSQIAENWDDGVYSEENGDYTDYPDTDEEQTYVPNASTAVDYDDTYENEDYQEDNQNSEFVDYDEDTPFYDEDAVYGADAPYDESGDEVYGEEAPYDTDDEVYGEEAPYDTNSEGYEEEEPYDEAHHDGVDDDYYAEHDQYGDGDYPADDQYGDDYPTDDHYEDGYHTDDHYEGEDAQYGDEDYHTDDQYTEADDHYEDDQYVDDHQYKGQHTEESHRNQGTPEPDPSAMVADDDDDWSIPEKEPMPVNNPGTLNPRMREGASPKGFRNTPYSQKDVRPTRKAEPEVEDDSDDFSSLSVDENVVDAYRNDTTNVIVKEKVVVKHIPIDGAKGGLFAGLVNGTSKRTFVVTGDRGTGVTSLAWEMAKFLSQSIPVLYFDCDVRTHGLLSYVEYNEVIKYGNAQLQGTKFCKNTNSFYNCVIPYADNLDIITSNYGTRTTKDELAVTAQVIAEKSLDYGAVIIDAPFDTLPVIEDLLVSSTILFCVTATKVGFMNAVCILEDNELSQRYLRQMFTKGKMVFTKKNKHLKVDALKKYVNDIIELEDINWLEMNAVVLGEKVDSNFVAALLD